MKRLGFTILIALCSLAAGYVHGRADNPQTVYVLELVPEIVGVPMHQQEMEFARSPWWSLRRGEWEIIWRKP